MKTWIQVKDNKVSSFSDVQSKFENAQVEVEVTEEQLKQLASNDYDVYYKEGKLDFVKGEKLEHKEKQSKYKDTIKKIRSGNYEGKDLADLLEKLI